MKQLLFLSVVLIALGSCVQRQKSNITGRTDEVYFTPSDTRIKVVASESEYKNSASTAKRTTTPNYTGSYSDRLSNFGSSNRFNYNNYQPTLSPTLMYNNYSGWGVGMSYGGYNSPFSPYYGYNMPYNNPFYANGWGGGWMTNYYPCYTYNPYMFNSGPYGYGSYGGYNNYNNYSGYNNSNSGNSGSNANYARRTGTYSPSTQNNTVNRSDNNSNTNTTSNSNSNSGNSWWKTSSGGSGTTNSGGNTGNSGGGGGRSGGGGNSSSSTRRR